jgi:hypothetical protein
MDLKGMENLKASKNFVIMSGMSDNILKFIGS